MKRQSQLLMYAGIMAGVIMTSCKSSDSVVMYDDQVQPRVYKATKGDAAARETSRTYARGEQSGKEVYRTTTTTNTIVKSVDQQPVYQPQPNNVAVVHHTPNYQNSPVATTQYMPEVVDMTNKNKFGQSAYNCSRPVKSVNPNYGAYNYVQDYNPRSSRYNQSAGRNRSLDHNLYNRPNAYTLTDDMYTPEYRSMMHNRQNGASYGQQPSQNVQVNPYGYYDGVVTVENGTYNNQPRIVQQQQYYTQAQPQYQEPQPQQYVVPVEAQQQYYYPQPQVNASNNYTYAYSQNEVRQPEANYPATLYFKNGAKLTGTLVNVDNQVCVFKMSEGRMTNFATKDILKIERR